MNAVPLQTRSYLAWVVFAFLAIGSVIHPALAEPAGTTVSTTPDWREDVKAYFTAPLHWGKQNWLKFGGLAAAVAVSYQYDDTVRNHFDTRITTEAGHEDYDVRDALPAAGLVAGTLLYATLTDNIPQRRTAATMLEAAGLSAVTAFVLKRAIGRKRPYETSDPGNWHGGDGAFPSLHTAAAFAIGTVFAESGKDSSRWWRRLAGYGIAVGTAYARMDHGEHWLSDTIAGAGLGIATARFLMHRHDPHSPMDALTILPLNGGLMLSYQVALAH